MKNAIPRLAAWLFFSTCAVGAPAGLHAAGGLHLLRVEEQTYAEPSVALVSGEESTLQILAPFAPADSAPADATPVFRQLSVSGGLAAPLAVEAAALPSTHDPRITRLRVRAPAVTRVTRFDLWLGKFGPVALTVFPAERPREDNAPLADTLATSGLRLAVCGAATDTAELRAHLRAEKIDFDDLGASAPENIPADTLLLGLFRPEDLEHLAARPGGPLLAFVDDPALLPGVYSESPPSAAPSARRAIIKITLPLAPLLASDPRARETLHRLILQALPPPPPARR